MATIILDSAIINNNPDVLNLDIPIEFIIGNQTYSIVSSSSKINSILNQAIKKGRVTVFNDVLESIHNLNIEGLSNELVEMIQIAHTLLNSHNFYDIRIASDKITNDQIDIEDIDTLSNDDIRILVNNRTLRTSRFRKKELEEYKKRQIKEPKKQSIIVSGLYISGVLFYYFNREIISTISVWGTITLAIIFAFSLYVIREKWRLSYGITEFLFGVTAIVSLFLNDRFRYSIFVFNIDFSVKVVAGLYIMVRGLDNAVKGLKGKTLGIWLKTKYGIGEG